MKNLFNLIKNLSTHKQYLYYSLAYGLSTLIVPLGVQFLVNNLALSAIGMNISVFILFIVVALIFTQIIRHSQIILVESLQREILCIEMEDWKDFKNKKYAHYYFEVFNLLKSFSKSYTNLIELGLIIFFGLITIIMFHPFFLVIAMIIIMTLVIISKSTPLALKTSFDESDQKYLMHEKLYNSESVSEDNLIDFLKAREEHFKVTKANSFKISAIIVIVHTLLLSIGCYLIQINQLSVGQLVSAEIIISGILIPISKLPLTLEAVYDYETSKYKIKKAIGYKNG